VVDDVETHAHNSSRAPVSLALASNRPSEGMR
jgi:hypothetical protein